MNKKLFLPLLLFMTQVSYLPYSVSKENNNFLRIVNDVVDSADVNWSVD